MDTTYTPCPVDTSDVTLPLEIDRLTGLLAAQIHDVWALGRLAEGWRYGAHRDDTRKLTPCLVPFADLPPSRPMT